VKLKKNQLKELIWESIYELSKDKGDMDNDGKNEPDSEEYLDNKDKAIKKAMKSEGGPGSGRRPDGDVGGPAHPNVPKKKKGRPTKPGSAKDIDNKAMSAADAANAKMDAAEKAMKAKKKKKANESVGKRCTVKEVKLWMKTLEENRYKKTYNSDARRVSWMVNHMGESLDNMPISMKKKWTKAQYGRERYLAKEFIKSKKQQMMENKLRGLIKKVIKEELNEGKKRIQLQIPVKDKLKVDKILKKLGAKIGKNYDIGVGRTGTFILDLDRKIENKVLELMIKNRVQVKEV
jgi:hypothetical protein